MIFVAKLDRLAIGSILRSKLVFLINVRLREGIFDLFASATPSGWALIMRAIKCLKGIRWMPWR